MTDRRKAAAVPLLWQLAPYGAGAMDSGTVQNPLRVYAVSNMTRKEEEGPKANTVDTNSWLCMDGPEEQQPQHDDFEGNRNWAVILILLALVVGPIAALVLILL